MSYKTCHVLAMSTDMAGSDLPRHLLKRCLLEQLQSMVTKVTCVHVSNEKPMVCHIIIITRVFPRAMSTGGGWR